MRPVLSIDFESRSAIDLKTHGAHVYWEHPSTIALCAAWAIGDGPVQIWRPGMGIPAQVEDHIRSGPWAGIVSGWNVGFERLAIERHMAPVYGWSMPRPEQYEDTMAMAAAMSLPRSLDEAALAIGLTERKDEEGYKLMLKLTRPNGSNDPALLERLYAYCKQDVVVERAMRKTMLPLSDRERQLYLFDAEINRRGVLLDSPLVDAMKRIADGEKVRLNESIAQATAGAITTTNQSVKIAKWLTANGAPTESVAKAVVNDLLEQELPPQARHVIEIRQEAAKSSTAKLKTAKLCVCQDGRMRGLLQFLGADSGRWAGRLLQPQNFPRPSGLVKDPDGAIPWLMGGSAEAIEFRYGWPLRAVADSLRSIIVAKPGHDLIAADFSSIESRLLAWVAGEDWKLLAYQAQDEGHGAGIYEINGAQIFGVPVEDITDDDPRRQVGKTAELSMGYAGGVTALMKMARNYNTNMAVALPALLSSAPEDRIERAERRHADCLKRQDSSADILSKDAWMACELTKLAWRAANPLSCDFWHQLELASREAVDNPGTRVATINGMVTFVVAKGVLWQRLPSGRVIAWPNPKVALLTVPWADTTQPEEKREKRRTVTALNVEGKKLYRQPLYGGKLCAYTIQGSARDLLADAMLRVEAAGYPVVLTVHDEVVCEIPHDFGSLGEFQAIVEASEPWANGLPVTSKGYRSARFKKG